MSLDKDSNNRISGKFKEEYIEYESSELMQKSVSASDESSRLNLLTYHRYSIPLIKKYLHEDLGLKDIEPKEVAPMDCVDHIDDLLRVGDAIVKQERFENKLEKDFEGFLQ